MTNETKIVYAYDADGKYTQTLILDHTDRSQVSGAWQIPAQCAETAPPDEKGGFDRVFKNDTWKYVEQSKEDEPVPPEPPPVQDHEQIDQNVLDLAEAVLELSAEIEKLKGSAKQ